MSDYATKKDIQEVVGQEIDKLINAIQSLAQDLAKHSTQSKQSHDEILTSFDSLSKQVETHMQEMLALAHKVDRMERWIHKIAQATGVKLDFDD